MTMTNLDDVSRLTRDIRNLPSHPLLRAVDRLRKIAAWGSIATVTAVVGSYACCERPAHHHYEDIGPDPETLPLPPPVTAPDAELIARARPDIDAGALLVAVR
jgi:hypothetical protein